MIRLYVLLIVIFLSSGAVADDNTRCKLFNNCSYSTRAADKGAELVIEDTNVDAKGYPVKPADIGGNNGAEGIGKNVDVQIKQPANKYVKGEKRKKQLESSEVDVGTVRVDTETGKTELQSPPTHNADKCDYSYLVGKKLDEVTLPKNARVLHEGDAITMEYMEGRVNIILDKNDVIVNVTCS